MIFGVPPLSDGLTTFSLEVERGGVEKHEIKIDKKTAAMVKHILLDHVFRTTGSKRGSVLLIGEFLAEKGHGTIKLVQGDLLSSRYHIGRTPFLASAVGPGNKKAVQHSQEQRPFHGEAEFAGRDKR